jgi:hypothetical protein
MGLGQPSDLVVSRLRFPRATRLEAKLRLLEIVSFLRKEALDMIQVASYVLCVDELVPKK